MEEKFTKLAEFGQKIYKCDEDLQPLRHFMEEDLELVELVEMIPKVVQNSDVVDLCNSMFLGLTQKQPSQKKRFRIIESIITHLELDSSSSANKSVVVNKVVTEVEKLKTLHLVKICTACVEMIRSEMAASRRSWKDVLPKILSLLCDKKEVNHCGTEMSGKDYKRDVIKTLCMTNVNSDVIIPFAAMFTEIPLTSDEHEQVVKKLCDSFNEIEHRLLPPLVQQLLRLCKNEHIVIVFLKLRTFFSKYLYSFNNNETGQELDEDAKAEIIEAENIILARIEEFARISRINDLMKLCKNASNASCLLLDPFLLAVLLILSSMPAYEVQVSDLLRTMLTQAVCEEERKKESSWLSGIIDYNSDVDMLFSMTIQSRLCEHEKVINGLVNLGFSLLSISGVKVKETSLKKIWRVGRIILVSVIKKHKDIAKSVLQNLTDRIITGNISQQYTDCLLHLCNVASSTMINNFPMVTRILEFINTMPGIVSQRIVVALIPLVQISLELRDNLIMCLRKSLFSKNVEIRQTAVLGFLQLLKFLKLQRISSFSQNTITPATFQGPSVFTQICMDVHSQQTFSQQIKIDTNSNINEAICYEVIGILKRCFMQQAPVKNTLYKGLFAAISINPKLCISVLDVLLDHFNQYYEIDLQTLPPVAFNKVVIVQHGEVILQEPVGCLIFLIQDVLCLSRKVVSANEHEFENEYPRCITKFTEILDSLIQRFSQCDLNHFQLDENTILADNTTDSLKTQETVKQVLSSYEALMAYVINAWGPNDTANVATRLIFLHKSYHCIADFARNSEKASKKKDTATLENGEKKKKGTKRDKNSAIKKTPFKMPPTILSLKTIHKLLSIFLLDEVEWSSDEAHKELKPRRRVFNYAMITALDAIHQMKIRLNEESRSSAVFKDVCALARLIFMRCVSRYTEIADFEVNAAITSVECFSEIVTLMLQHYKSKFPQFLEETVMMPADQGLVKQLLPILKVYQILLKTVLDPDSPGETTAAEEVDPTTKVLITVILNAISTVVLTLPVDNEKTAKVLRWLTSIAEKNKFSSTSNVKIFVNLLLTMQNRCNSELTLLDSLSLQLCQIFPSINEVTRGDNVRPFEMVTENSKLTVFPMVCATLMSHLDDAEYMITRLKSEVVIVTFLKDTEDTALTQCSKLKRKERELCQHVMNITGMTKTVISIAAPSGPCLESEIKLLTRVFSVLTSLTKYFTLRSTANDLVYKNAMFHKLVKVVGSQFLRQEASDLLLYVEKDYENENRRSVSQLAIQAKKQYILLPKLVSELESFPKAILQLSKKCKDTSLSVKLTITRDFRLNVKKVDELIARQNESDSDEEEEGNDGTALSNRTNTESSQKRKRSS